MNRNEIQEAMREIGMMFKAFPSSQSSISGETVEAYLEAVEDFDVEAIRQACKAFRKNQVKGHNADFVPSAPKLVDECERQQNRLRWEAFTADHVFVVEGSDDWRRMAIARGVGSFPTKDVGGKQGWYLPTREVEQAKAIELPKPEGGKILPQLRKM